jgi:hypothetical protein
MWQTKPGLFHDEPCRLMSGLTTQEPSSTPSHSAGMTSLPSLLAIPAVLLAACSPLPAEPPSSGSGTAASCNADALSTEFVGQDASVVFATTFTAPVRVIRPGDAVTEDFNPARINFVLDANERVKQVYCG